jgi:hypothetical protein
MHLCLWCGAAENTVKEAYYIGAIHVKAGDKRQCQRRGEKKPVTEHQGHRGDKGIGPPDSGETSILTSRSRCQNSSTLEMPEAFLSFILSSCAISQRMSPVVSRNNS